MADYKHRASTKSSNQRTGGGNAGLWFFGGLITGAFLMGLVWLKYAPELAAGKVPGISPPASSPQAGAAKAEKAPKPHFEFYTMLPEMEVVIPDEEVSPPKGASAPAAAASAPPPSSRPSAKQTNKEPAQTYFLQMGSYRNFGDADRLKAKLALMGIEAEIQKVTINNKDTYHRVRSGPYRNQDQLNRARQMAKNNNISTLVIKLKD